MTYRQDPKTAARVFRDEVAIIVPSDRRVNILNRVASDVWNLCEGKGRTLDEICERLTERYDAPTETIRRETKIFISELISLGALIKSSESADR